MSPHPVQHSTIVLGSAYGVAPALVFAALTEPSKRRDVGRCCRPLVIVPEHTDFQVGGSELVRFGNPAGPRFLVRSIYQDIVPDLRIVTSEVVYEAETRVSIGLTTFELSPHRKGMQLKLTAQLIALAADDVLEEAGARYPALLDGLARYFETATG